MSGLTIRVSSMGPDGRVGRRLGIELERDPVLRTFIPVGMVAAAVVAVGIGGQTFAGRLFWLTQVLFDVVFVVFSARASRVPGISAAVRRFWSWIAAAGLFFVLGDTTQVVLTFVTGESLTLTGATVPQLLVALGIMVAVTAMLRHPIRVAGRERLRWWLDAATIMTGAAAVIWYFVWSSPEVTDPAQLGVVVFESGLILVSAFSLIKLLLGGNAPFTRTAGIAGGVSAAGDAVATAFGSFPTATFSITVIMGLRLVPLVLLAATPRIQEVQVRVDPGQLEHRIRPLYSRLPYVAIAATQVLLIGALLVGGLDARSWGVVAALVLSTGLVVARQLVAFADNTRLLANLDAAVLLSRQQEQRFRSMVQYASDLTILADDAWVITYASPSSDQILGVRPDELVGADLRRFVIAEDRSILDKAQARVLAEPQAPITVLLRTNHTDGSTRWVELIDTNWLHDPSVASIICNLRDVTSAYELQEQLRYEATHDTLTRLANRALFGERVRTNPAAGQFGDELVGMLVVDLDDFKDVNDTYGHDIGDELLAVLAGRLTRCVRPTDTVARIGGDEFAVLLPGAVAEQAMTVARRIFEAVAEPVSVDHLRLSTHASVGVAVGRRVDADRLLRLSDEAMYESKRAGVGPVILPAAG